MMQHLSTTELIFARKVSRSLFADARGSFPGQYLLQPATLQRLQYQCSSKSGRMEGENCSSKCSVWGILGKVLWEYCFCSLDCSCRRPSVLLLSPSHFLQPPPCPRNIHGPPHEEKIFFSMHSRTRFDSHSAFLRSSCNTTA